LPFLKKVINNRHFLSKTLYSSGFCGVFCSLPPPPLQTGVSADLEGRFSSPKKRKNKRKKPNRKAPKKQKETPNTKKTEQPAEQAKNVKKIVDKSLNVKKMLPNSEGKTLLSPQAAWRSWG